MTTTRTTTTGSTAARGPSQGGGRLPARRHGLRLGRIAVLISVAVLTLLVHASCVADRELVRMLNEATFVRFPELEMDDLDPLITRGDPATVRGPAGYFPGSVDDHEYRVLAIDGDGQGGVAVDLSGHADLRTRIRTVPSGRSVWLVVRGDVEQFVTRDHMDRATMPDAIFSDAEVVGFFETAEHVFRPPAEP